MSVSSILCFTLHPSLSAGGFCFVEYYTRSDAEYAMRYINQTRLDDRIIRTDWDAGFIDGRQFGRGRSGGQVRWSPRSLTVAHSDP